MKKVALLLLALILLLPSCGSKTPTDLRLDKDGNYVGFSDIPADTAALALERGSLVIDINGLSSMGPEEHNVEAWYDFLDKSRKGDEASLRVAVFNDGVGSYWDLYYRDDIYRLFRQNKSGEIIAEKYRYLHALPYTVENSHSGIEHTVTRYILTDNADTNSAQFNENGALIHFDAPYALLDFASYLPTPTEGAPPLTSVSNSDSETDLPPMDDNGVYLGFSDIPRDTPELALERGSLVIATSRVSDDQIHNSELWDAFLQKTAQGKNATLRVAVFNNGRANFYTNLYYEDGLYWLYQKNAHMTTGKSYSHLFRLEVKRTPWGTYGPETRVLYVLTNDADMTADNFEWFGSQTSPSCEIPHAVLDFADYLE